MNVVMTSSGGLVEVQGTAEGAPFSARSSTRCWLWQTAVSPSCWSLRHTLSRRRPRNGTHEDRLSVGELGPFVLATTNPNKAREIREIFAGAGLRLELLARPADVADVEETEPTLLGNARLKASSLVESDGAGGDRRGHWARSGGARWRAGRAFGALCGRTA